ncbi:MAG: ABC transporter, partial [Flavobacteriaceae bacterium]
MNKSAVTHWGILITNQSDKRSLIRDLMSPDREKPSGFDNLLGKKGALFSKLELDKLIEEEVKHDKKLLTSDTDQSLQSFSSGERKKALFR